jgi:hypothetical protein
MEISCLLFSTFRRRFFLAAIAWHEIQLGSGGSFCLIGRAK